MGGTESERFAVWGLITELVTSRVTGLSFTLDNVPVEGAPSSRLRRHRGVQVPS